jgi:hypothetical protein
MIVNYDPKRFIVQATGVYVTAIHFHPRACTLKYFTAVIVAVS